MLKAEIDRAYPELKGMGNSNAIMDFIIRCVQEAWETLGPELSNKLAKGMQKRGHSKGCKWVVYEILSYQNRYLSTAQSNALIRF
jgi:hypothetical protein